MKKLLLIAFITLASLQIFAQCRPIPIVNTFNQSSTIFCINTAWRSDDSCYFGVYQIQWSASQSEWDTVHQVTGNSYLNVSSYDGHGGYVYLMSFAAGLTTPGSLGYGIQDL